jgi:hypothetical protein
MNTTSPTREPVPEKREPVLNTVDRVTELCFGLFMALTFVGAIKAVTAGEDAGRKLFIAALGCNLAWGLADAVMFLVRTLADRGQRLTLALTVKREPDRAVAVQVLRCRRRWSRWSTMLNLNRFARAWWQHRRCRRARV